jgi:N-methylhydantoinase A
MLARLIGVDVGGTFTDVVAIENGAITVTKVPTNPQATERSVLEGADQVEVSRAGVFNLATTAGINALITRRLPKIGFLATLGHRDILDRGRMWRPYEAMHDPSWRRGFSDTSRPLVPRYLRRGIKERLKSDGSVLIPLDEEQAVAELDVLKECGVEGVAVCLLHAWLNPAHEQRLRELIRRVLGDLPCSISSEVCPLAKEYQRASTTTVDLLMKLTYAGYAERLAGGLADRGFRGDLNFADCSAMLMPAAHAVQAPYRLVLGGPAAGTVAGQHFGALIGKPNLLCADVGGTSCDISVVLDGRPWTNDSLEVEWDLIVTSASTDVVTLGAGGGSLVSIGRSGELRVGPGSAGADPGPACYSKGGDQPTVTDAALLIGILAADRFLGGRMPLDERRALAAFEGLETRLSVAERIRQAWLIGLQNIAEGIFDLTIRRGLDPRDLSLMAFGAAGPMLLPQLLDLLPLEGVIVPPHPGDFSALGLLSSDQMFSQSRTLYGVLEPAMAPRIQALLNEMAGQLLDRAGLRGDQVRIVRSVDARLLGQSWETPFIALPDGPIDGAAVQEIVATFHREYEKRNNSRFEAIPVEGVTYRVQVLVPSEKVRYPALRARSGPAVEPTGRAAIRHLYEVETTALSYERDALAAGDVIAGPAIVHEELSTTFVPAGRHATVGDHGELVIG